MEELDVLRGVLKDKIEVCRGKLKEYSGDSYPNAQIRLAFTFEIRAYEELLLDIDHLDPVD